MSRIKLILALALVAVAGCSKNELVADGVLQDKVPMSFGVYARTLKTSPAAKDGSSSQAMKGAATKAGSSYIETGTVLPDDSHFGVFAFYQEGTIGSYTGVWADQDSRLWTPNFMFNQDVRYNGSGALSGENYKYSPMRYWPANEENTLSFWAYYPYSAYSTDNSGVLQFFSDASCTTAYSSTSINGLPVAKYTVPASPSAQEDIMFDSFANTDKTWDNCTPTKGTVPFTFRHALCAVRFKVEMPSGAGNQGSLDEMEGTSYKNDYDFKFNTLVVKNLPQTGICASPGSATISWAASGSMDVASTDYDRANFCTETFLLLPATLGDDITVDAEMEIHFRAEDDPDNRAADLVYPFKVENLKLNAATDGPSSWVAGTRYTYTFKLSLDRIEFSASTGDWDTPIQEVTITE